LVKTILVLRSEHLFDRVVDFPVLELHLSHSLSNMVGLNPHLVKFENEFLVSLIHFLLRLLALGDAIRPNSRIFVVFATLRCAVSFDAETFVDLIVAKDREEAGVANEILEVLL